MLPLITDEPVLVMAEPASTAKLVAVPSPTVGPTALAPDPNIALTARINARLSVPITR